MLADGQDPDALEARLAYHLHRLDLTGAPLREVLKGKAYLATALSQARVSIEPAFITELARALYVAAYELNRDLLHDEAREWSFYRSSAHARRTIWQAVETHIHANNLTHTFAAHTLCMDRQKLVDNFNGRRRNVLERKQIANLLLVTNAQVDPEHWLGTVIADKGGDPQISTPEL